MLKKFNPNQGPATRASVRMNPAGDVARASLAKNVAGLAGNVSQFAAGLGAEFAAQDADEKTYAYTFQRAAKEYEIKYTDGKGQPIQRVMRDENGIVMPALPEKGNVPLSFFDQTFRAGILAKYSQESRTNINKTLQQLAKEHHDDPMAFSNAADAYRNAYLAEMPVEVKKALGSWGRNVTLQMFTGLEQHKVAKERRLQAKAATDGLQVDQRDLLDILSSGVPLTEISAKDGSVILNSALTNSFVSFHRNLTSLVDQKHITKERQNIITGQFYESIAAANFMREVKAKMQNSAQGYVAALDLAQSVRDGKEVIAMPVMKDGKIEFVQGPVKDFFNESVVNEGDITRVHLASSIVAYAKGYNASRIKAEQNAKAYYAAQASQIMNDLLTKKISLGRAGTNVPELSRLTEHLDRANANRVIQFGKALASDQDRETLRKIERQLNNAQANNTQERFDQESRNNPDFWLQLVSPEGGNVPKEAIEMMFDPNGIYPEEAQIAAANRVQKGIDEWDRIIAKTAAVAVGLHDRVQRGATDSIEPQTPTQQRDSDATLDTALDLGGDLSANNILANSTQVQGWLERTNGAIVPQAVTNFMKTAPTRYLENPNENVGWIVAASDMYNTLRTLRNTRNYLGKESYLGDRLDAMYGKLRTIGMLNLSPDNVAVSNIVSRYENLDELPARWDTLTTEERKPYTDAVDNELSNGDWISALRYPEEMKRDLSMVAASLHGDTASEKVGRAFRLLQDGSYWSLSEGLMYSPTHAHSKTGKFWERVKSTLPFGGEDEFSGYWVKNSPYALYRPFGLREQDLKAMLNTVTTKDGGIPGLLNKHFKELYTQDKFA
ncbi:MAG: hypothetical protein CL885_02185, partial [Dehalococcoidia bacterium]|nr:hypothetical protein [Dehalococcoidia bacterium]